MSHGKSNRGADWRDYCTSAEAEELEAIDRRIVALDRARQRLTDRRRRLYDRVRKRAVPRDRAA